MILLEDKNRDYQRYRQSISEKLYLANRGFQHVLSSNVSAVGVKDSDLIIRFHNGSIYRYMNYGDRFDSIMASNSKGKWVWKYLRRGNVPYEKIGTISFPDDINVSDEEIFRELDEQYTSDLTRNVVVEVTRQPTNENVTQTNIGDLVVYQTPVVENVVVYEQDINKVLETDMAVSILSGFTVFNLGGIDIYKPTK